MARSVSHDNIIYVLSHLEQNWALVCVRPKLHLLPDWPDTQATALGHVCQVLLCFSHVLVDGVHPFLNSLQLLCEEQSVWVAGGEGSAP